MRTLLYANRAEPKSISVISILLFAAALGINKLRCVSLLRKIFEDNIYTRIGNVTIHHMCRCTVSNTCHSRTVCAHS